jgi:hypothetical protein
MKRFIIRKGFGKWSSSTVVELLNQDHKNETATVRHPSSSEVFTVPMDNLVAKRDRGN